MAKRLNQEAASQRKALADLAEEEFRAGTLPTWRMQDVGRVQASVTAWTAQVSDMNAFTKWVGERYPTELMDVVQVRASWMNSFLDNAGYDTDGDVIFDPASGEVVPGLSLRRGGQFKGISIYAHDDTKAAMAAIAEAELRDFLNQVEAPVVLAELAHEPVA